ncbi:hypothetical protein N9A63_01605 [Akkermansiaceae bacterium]|nr:hypothetical protein [Akkermansiaceae bacterium]
MRCFYLLIFALLFSLATGEEAKRTWTATDGRSFEGKFVSATETEVKISKKGRPVTVPLKMLSEGDRDFVKEKLAGAELASRSFETSPFGEFIKDEWVKVPKESYGLVFQVYGTKKMTRSKEPVPLFIHLHGAGARADDVQAGKVEIAPQEVAKEGLYKKNPCLIIVPLCPPDTGWGDQVSKLEAIIDEAIKTAPIDPKRIYISGYSMGARGCDSLIKSRPKFYAAALFADGDANRKWSEMTDTALWMIYSGERDMKKAEEVAKAYQEAGKVVHYEAFPKATHNQIHWKLAKDDKVFPWMFEQVRN